MTGKEIRIISLLVLDTLFFLLEAIIGYTVHSLALVADSFHMLNDIISLFIALWAVKVKTTKKADGNYTYGWQRAEILGALINAVFLIALCFTIVIEAIQRLISPPEISSPVLVLVVGIAGLISNILGLFLFHEHGHSHGLGLGLGHGHSHTDEEAFSHSHDHELQTHEDEFQPLLNSSRNPSTSDFSQFMPENVISRIENQHKKIPHKPKKKSMNMEGVFLHVLGDALGNIGVIIAALIIWKTNWPGKYYSDPLISLIITVIIFSSALPLCKKSSKILLQATPPTVDTDLVIAQITKLPSIESVHDFHVWNLNEDILVGSLHIELNEDKGEFNNSNKHFNKKQFIDTVTQVREVLHKFDIHTATIQPEFNSNLRLSRSNTDAYGETNEVSCVLDNTSGCFNEQCLKHT